MAKNPRPVAQKVTSRSDIPKTDKPKKLVRTDNTWRTRYAEAYKADFITRYPSAYKDGHYCAPKYPKVSTANGLTNAVCNYINWTGGVGNRINVQGRMVDGIERTESGLLLGKKKFMKSTTLKGTADIIATLHNGVTWHIEIKVGKDKPRDRQIEMQARIRKTGSHYDFIHDMGEFFEMYDSLVNSVLF